MLRTNWYNYIRKSFTDYGVCVKIAYWAPKEQKYQSSSKKGPQGCPKSENQLYLNYYDTMRPKNWQMLRTNWYNYFRNTFRGYNRVRQNYLLGAKGAKISVDHQKGLPRGSKIRKSAIS